MFPYLDTELEFHLYVNLSSWQPLSIVQKNHPQEFIGFADTFSNNDIPIH